MDRVSNQEKRDRTKKGDTTESRAATEVMPAFPWCGA